jgi:hypothetical protein
MSNQQLLDIIKESRQLAADDRKAPLLECPNDGTPLKLRNGTYNCPMGDYRTRRTTRDPNQ